MALTAVDVSSHQAGLDVGKLDADIIIVKATEGVTYTNPEMSRQLGAAVAAGKPVGIYHFARNRTNSAKDEAAFFVKTVRPWLGKAVLWLDWEDGSGVSDTAWAKAWLDAVRVATGQRVGIYMSESVTRQDWSKVATAEVPLWVAKYRDMTPDTGWSMTNAGTPPKVSHWTSYALWQWTSSGLLPGWSKWLDLNAVYLSREQWAALAAPITPVTPPVTPPKENPVLALPTSTSQVPSTFRGKPLNKEAVLWAIWFEHVLLREGIIKQSVDMWQGIGGAAASGGTHALGWALDIAQKGRAIELARKYGARGSWFRPYNWDGRGGMEHSHLVLSPGSSVNRYQIAAVDAGYNGLGYLGRGGRDTGPRPFPKIDWLEGVARMRRDYGALAIPTSTGVLDMTNTAHRFSDLDRTIPPGKEYSCPLNAKGTEYSLAVGAKTGVWAVDVAVSDIPAGEGVDLIIVDVDWDAKGRPTKPVTDGVTITSAAGDWSRGQVVYAGSVAKGHRLRARITNRTKASVKLRRTTLNAITN